MIPRYIAAPLVGCVIGYITNDIAIRMLFHPHEPVYIGKFQLPFTPGLVPRQKGRIAKSIGRVVNEQLLNTDLLRDSALSEKTLNAVRLGIQDEIDKWSADTRTLRELLSSTTTPEGLTKTREQLCTELSALVMTKLLNAHVGKIIADSFSADLNRMFPDMVFSLFLTDMMTQRISGFIEHIVDEKLEEKGPEVIADTISQTVDELLDMQLCVICEKYADYVPQIIEGGIFVYQEILSSHLEPLLEALDLERLIVEKISAFSAEQMEAMIFGILNKELKAIVYLGALLGAMMGFINLLF